MQGQIKLYYTIIYLYYIQYLNYTYSLYYILPIRYTTYTINFLYDTLPILYTYIHILPILFISYTIEHTLIYPLSTYRALISHYYPLQSTNTLSITVRHVPQQKHFKSVLKCTKPDLYLNSISIKFGIKNKLYEREQEV